MKRRNFVRSSLVAPLAANVLISGLLNVRGLAAQYTQVGDCYCGIESYDGCEEVALPGGGVKTTCEGLKKEGGAGSTLDGVPVIITCKNGTDDIVSCAAWDPKK
jgi:hypothetical protein